MDATSATSLQRVANRPILGHVLDALVGAGVTEAVVVAPPHGAAEIMACVEQERPAALAAAPLIRDYHSEPTETLEELTEMIGEAPVIVHSANGLLGQPLAPLLDLLDERIPDMVLLVAPDARNTEHLAPSSQRMLNIAELHPAKSPFGVAGVCVLAPGALRRARLARLTTQGLELQAMGEGLAEDGGCIRVCVVRTWRRFTGEAVDLLALNRAVLDTIAGAAPVAESNGNHFEGQVQIDDSASVTSSVICGPVIIGAGAQIADSYIGPHTAIGERVSIEGAEIERSIVLAGASVQHVGGRLVASVVGREARVFRDFSVPRAIRLQVGDGDQVALC